MVAIPQSISFFIFQEAVPSATWCICPATSSRVQVRASAASVPRAVYTAPSNSASPDRVVKLCTGPTTAVLRINVVSLLPVIYLIGR